MKTITRDEFRKKLEAGRKLVWATLEDRQDFFVEINFKQRWPVRDVTDEPAHHSRSLIRMNR